MIPAVCGFLFSSDVQRITLIRKNRPGWQRGRLNGVGGKREGAETPIETMRREFEEEAGVRVEDWQQFFVLEDKINDVYVTYFRAFGDVDACRSVTDEEVEVWPVGAIYTLPILPNLTWLVPMALDRDFTSGRGLWTRP